MLLLEETILLKQRKMNPESSFGYSHGITLSETLPKIPDHRPNLLLRTIKD